MSLVVRNTRNLALALSVALAAACGSSSTPRPTLDRGLIIIGIDGMDAELTRRYMADGTLPNLRALAERGEFVEMQTTFPPQSPVAWSAFITGKTSSEHGIFDFVHRDPVGLEPYLSTSRIEEPEYSVSVGSLYIPLSAPDVVLLREGRAFWLDLEDAQVPATLVKNGCICVSEGTNIGGFRQGC